MGKKMRVPFPHNLKQEAGASTFSLVPPLLLGLPSLVCREGRRQKSPEVHQRLITLMLQAERIKCSHKKTIIDFYIWSNQHPSSVHPPIQRPLSPHHPCINNLSSRIHPKLHSCLLSLHNCNGTCTSSVKLDSISPCPSSHLGKSENEAWTKP